MPDSKSETTDLASLAPALELLTAHQGIYKGHGSNFEGHPFKATLELTSRVSGSLIELQFLASDDESVFHEELTWITPDLKTDRLCLWTVSTNTPGVLCHVLSEDRRDDFRERRFVFRLGEPTDRHSFRQEIVLDLMRDGALEYRYSWGVPHEDFSVRVQAKLTKI
jgi:hypothetical protein